MAQIVPTDIVIQEKSTDTFVQISENFLNLLLSKYNITNIENIVNQIKNIRFDINNWNKNISDLMTIIETAFVQNGQGKTKKEIVMAIVSEALTLLGVSEEVASSLTTITSGFIDVVVMATQGLLNLNKTNITYFFKKYMCCCS